MKTAFRCFCLFVVLLLTIVLCVSAHSGGTDEAGGHYNHDTGVYHYHHGYPAHQHTGGKCPYAFADNTGQNSGGSIGGGSDFWGDSSDDSISIAIGSVVIAGIISLFLIVQMAKRKAGRSVSNAFEAVAGMSLFLTPAIALVCFILLFASEDTGPSLLMLASCGVVFIFSLLALREPSENRQKVPQENSTLCAESPATPSITTVSTVSPASHTQITPTAPVNTPKAQGPSVTRQSNIIGMRPVASSNLESVGYLKGTLYICFRGDRVYRYYDVPIKLFFSLIYAPSVGKFYNANIKGYFDSDYIGGKSAIPAVLTETAPTSNHAPAPIADLRPPSTDA